MIKALEIMASMLYAMKNGEDVTDILDIGKSVMKGGSGSTSLYRKAKNSIAFFPVIMSSSISSEPINPLLKALERQFATYIKIAIQQEDIVDLSNTRSKKEFLKTLGFNVDNKLLSLMENVDINLMTAAIKKEWKILSEVAEKKKKETVSFKPLHEIYEDKKQTKLITTLNETRPPGDSYSQEEILAIVHRTQDNLNALGALNSDRDVAANRARLGTEFGASYRNFRSKPSARTARALDTTAEKIQALRAKADPLYRSEMERMSNKRDRVELMNLQQQLRNSEDRETHSRSGAVVTISDSDIKKFSELPPTILDVAIYYKSGNTLHETTLTLGIKAVSHIFDSEEIIKNTAKGLKESNTVLRFLQWRTGEIKFWRDFLFNIDGIKEDAVTAYKKEQGSLWFRLKYLRHKDALSRIFSRGFTPTAVLVVSPSDINEIKKISGIDLWKTKDIKKLFDTFYIISFIVVDEASKLVYIHNGDDMSYMKVDYSYLTKEQSDDSMRSLIGLLTRG